MAYIYKRGKIWWVGYVDGGVSAQKSLRVTAKAAASALLRDYEELEGRQKHRSKHLILKKSVAEVFDAYIEKRAPREATKRWYRTRKRIFVDFCEDEGIELISEIDIDTVEIFYNKRKEGFYSRAKKEGGKARKKTPGGARADLRALRAVLGYAMKRGYIPDNPAKEVRADKPTKKLFRDLSLKDISTLLKTIKKRDPDFYPLFATAYYAGLRFGELIHLEPRDINFDEGYLLVRSKEENEIKDHQERKIPLHRELRELFLAMDSDSKWCFPTKDGDPRANNLNRKLKTIGKVAGIDVEGLTIQTFRETFGSHLLRRGVSIYLVSQYLGHSSVDVTTKHYAHIPIEETHDEINLL